MPTSLSMILFRSRYSYRLLIELLIRAVWTYKVIVTPMQITPIYVVVVSKNEISNKIYIKLGIPPNAK